MIPHSPSQVISRMPEYESNDTGMAPYCCPSIRHMGSPSKFEVRQTKVARR